MTSVGITKPGESSKSYDLPSGLPQGLPVFLDSGGTLSRLPTSLARAIVADFPGASLENGIWVVDCLFADQDGTVDFGFGNTTISVPFHEFIWQPAPDLCLLGVIQDTRNQPVLGGK